MTLREARNVPEFLQREALLDRVRRIRANAVEFKARLEDWNQLHPTERPIDTAFEDAVIAWCDRGGDGPIPQVPA